jgi:uncharacterized protein (DUF302 family)
MLMLWCGAAPADELIMARLTQSFPEAMNSLQQTIRDHGYVVSRVQRVDVGLTASGYPTAEYRLVFFGKPDEIGTLAARHPELIPYLPLEIVIFAEGEDSIVLAASPAKLAEFYPDPELARQFGIWDRDLRAIFDRLALP